MSNARTIADLAAVTTSAAATYTLELPNADGSAGQLLKTDGSGKLAFTSSVPSTITWPTKPE